MLVVTVMGYENTIRDRDVTNDFKSRVFVEYRSASQKGQQSTGHLPT